MNTSIAVVAGVFPCARRFASRAPAQTGVLSGVRRCGCLRNSASRSAMLRNKERMGQGWAP